MHENTLVTFQNMAKMRADVDITHIQAAERVRTLEVEADVTKKKMAEEEETKRNEKNNETKKTIADLEVKCREQVATINAETVKHGKLIEQQITAAEHQNKLNIKTLETNALTAVAEEDRKVKTQQAELNSRTEQLKITVNKEVELAKER